MPEHLRKIQQKALGEDAEKGEIDFDFWYFISKHLFGFSDQEFFDTTFRRLFILVEQHQKFHEKKK